MLRMLQSKLGWWGKILAFSSESSKFPNFFHLQIKPVYGNLISRVIIVLFIHIMYTVYVFYINFVHLCFLL